MKTTIRLSTAAVGCFLLLAATANAQIAGTPAQNPETGHYYQVFGRDAGVISWTQAASNTANLPWREPDGSTCTEDVDCSDSAVPPHLATITSARENDWVNALGQAELDAGALTASGRSQVWIGGVQSGTGAEPGGGWAWVNGEGPFPGTNGGVVYTNWHPDEPNNSGGNEEHLTLGRYGFGNGWNDEAQNRDSMGGYIVEWDLPRASGTCSDADGCTTIEGQTLSYPVPNAVVNFNSFEFLDPRVAAGTCGVDSLTIFGNSGYGPPSRPASIIPAYLCGSPKFVVVAVDAKDENGNDLFLDAGTIGVIHDTATILPGNVYPDGGVSVCEDPIPFTPYTDGDPQYQDVVGWSTTDPDRMRERTSGIATGIFVGDVGEFTNECGTSRARVKGSSNFFAGLHIDFGTGNEYAPGTYLNNFNRFVELGGYQLDLLKDSVDEAIADGAILKNGDEKKMRNMVDNAIKNYEAANYAGAYDHIENFVKFVVPARYASGPGIDNYEGEHTMRGTNLEFFIRVKIIPYNPAP